MKKNIREFIHNLKQTKSFSGKETVLYSLEENRCSWFDCEELLPGDLVELMMELIATMEFAFQKKTKSRDEKLKLFGTLIVHIMESMLLLPIQLSIKDIKRIFFRVGNFLEDEDKISDLIEFSSGILGVFMQHEKYKYALSENLFKIFYNVLMKEVLLKPSKVVAKGIKLLLQHYPGDIFFKRIFKDVTRVLRLNSEYSDVQWYLLSGLNNVISRIVDDFSDPFISWVNENLDLISVIMRDTTNSNLLHEIFALLLHHSNVVNYFHDSLYHIAIQRIQNHASVPKGIEISDHLRQRDRVWVSLMASIVSQQLKLEEKAEYETGSPVRKRSKKMTLQDYFQEGFHDNPQSWLLVLKELGRQNFLGNSSTRVINILFKYLPSWKKNSLVLGMDALRWCLINDDTLCILDYVANFCKVIIQKEIDIVFDLNLTVLYCICDAGKDLNLLYFKKSPQKSTSLNSTKKDQHNFELKTKYFTDPKFFSIGKLCYIFRRYLLKESQVNYLSFEERKSLIEFCCDSFQELDVHGIVDMEEEPLFFNLFKGQDIKIYHVTIFSLCLIGLCSDKESLISTSELEKVFTQESRFFQKNIEGLHVLEPQFSSMLIEKLTKIFSRLTTLADFLKFYEMLECIRSLWSVKEDVPLVFKQWKQDLIATISQSILNANVSKETVSYVQILSDVFFFSFKFYGEKTPFVLEELFHKLLFMWQYSGVETSNTNNYGDTNSFELMKKMMIGILRMIYVCYSKMPEWISDKNICMNDESLLLHIAEQHFLFDQYELGLELVLELCKKPHLREKILLLLTQFPKCSEFETIEKVLLQFKKYLDGNMVANHSRKLLCSLMVICSDTIADDSSVSSFIQDELLNFIHDPHRQVRDQSIAHIHQFISNFSDPEAVFSDIYLDVEEGYKHSKEITRKFAAETMIRCLKQAFSVSKCEVFVMNKLLHLYTSDFLLRMEIPEMVSEIILTKQSFFVMERIFPGILWDWSKRNSNLEKFPYDLFELTKQQFLGDYSPMFEAMLFVEDESSASICRDNFPYIFSLLYLQHKSIIVVKDYLEPIVPDLLDIYQEFKVDILMSVLLFYVFLPSFHGNFSLKLLFKLLDGLCYKEVVVRKTSGIFLFVYLEGLCFEAGEEESLVIFDIYEHLLMTVTPLREVPFYEIAFSFLTSCMKRKHLVERACYTMTKFCVRMESFPRVRSVLSQFLDDIVQSLSIYLVENLPDNLSSSILQLFKFFFLPEAFDFRFLIQVNFPSISQLLPFQQAQIEGMKELDPHYYIRTFIKEGEGIEFLYSIIKKDLYQIENSFHPKVVQKLVLELKRNNNKFARQCLGLLGLHGYENIEENIIEFPFENVQADEWTIGNVEIEVTKQALTTCNRFWCGEDISLKIVSLLAWKANIDIQNGILSPIPDNKKSKPISRFHSYQQRIENQFQCPPIRQIFEKLKENGSPKDIHNSWVKLISHLLSAKRNLIWPFSTLCYLDQSIAEIMFPYYVLYRWLEDSDESERNEIGISLRETLGDRFQIPTRSLQLILHTFNFLMKTHFLTPSFRHSKETKSYFFDPLTVSKRSFEVKAICTSLFYIEQHFEKQKVLYPPSQLMDFEENIDPIHQFIVDIYSKLSDPDALYGVSTAFEQCSRLLDVDNTQAIMDNLSFYDYQVSIDDANHSKMINSLTTAGLSSLSVMYSNSILEELNCLDDAEKESIFESFWRATQTCPMANSFAQGFHGQIFLSMTALQQSKGTLFTSSIQKASKLISAQDSIPEILCKFQMIKDLKSCWKQKSDSNESVNLSQMSEMSGESFITAFPPLPDTVVKNLPFEMFEPLLSLRMSLLKLRGNTNDLVSFGRYACELALNENRIEFARKFLRVITPHVKNYPEILLSTAHVFWKGDNQWKGLKILKFYETKVKGHPEELSSCHCTLAHWLHQSRLEDPDHILSQYHASGTRNNPQREKAFYTFGKLADSLASSLSKKFDSLEVKQRIKLICDNEKKLSEIKDVIRKQTTKSVMTRRYDDLSKWIHAERKEIKKLSRKIEEYTSIAIESYANCAVGKSSQYDMEVIFRMCSLWFANSTKKDVNAAFRRRYKTVSAFKYIPLAKQLASRLGTGNDDFNSMLWDILLRLVCKHPFHSFFHIFALKNGNRTSSEAAAPYFNYDENKLRIAKRLIHVASQHSSREVVRQMEILIEAYLELAFWMLDRKKYSNVKMVQIPKHFTIRKVLDLKSLPVITKSLPIQPKGNYSVVNYIRCYQNVCGLAGGINLPKILRCQGSDGNVYRELVKGNDDTRQDAIMEDLFLLVNKLLISDKETRRRRLQMKTYNVIPLSPTAGILEWVENTIPMGEYLTRVPDGAHFRYRPQDPPYRELIRELLTVKQTSQRLDKFRDICTRFQPVFHHFFLENFPDPVNWYEKRLNYIRSVACSSIVGYAVGIGDRHMFNILLDQSSAEVVHIDLGVAFEQGKMSSVPETVPFRLTRDIVDGMGIQGIEGTFRKCCIEVMKVLRKNTELLVPIVEVFTHDPLFKWSIDVTKQTNIYDLSESPFEQALHIPNKETNWDATRVLLRFQEKLDGYEDGQFFTCQGLVNKLINQARDEVLLSALFPGWGPFL